MSSFLRPAGCRIAGPPSRAGRGRRIGARAGNRGAVLRLSAEPAGTACDRRRSATRLNGRPRRAVRSPSPLFPFVDAVVVQRRRPGRRQSTRRGGHVTVRTFPPEFLWGAATAVLPDRRGRRRRRPRTVDLGHLQPHPRPCRQRRHRRRRCRPLPPLAVRHRADEGSRTPGLPVLRVLVAGPARRQRRVQRRGRRLLRSDRRRPARIGHRPGADSVPLGPARRTRAGRRLAEPGHGSPVRRLRIAPGPSARRPDRDLDDVERAVVRRVPRLRVGSPRAWSHRAGCGPGRCAPPEPRPWAGRPGDARRTRRRSPGLGHPATCTSSGRPIRTPLPTGRLSVASTPSATGPSSGRCSTAPTPTT